MTTKVLVLGGGLIGRVVALDLNQEEDLQVTVADGNANVVTQLTEEGLKCEWADFRTYSEISPLIKQTDLVVNAAPGNLAFNLLKWTIEENKNCVDVSFMPEDPYTLETTNKSSRVIVDCGLAPGLSNLVAGLLYNQFYLLTNLEIYVGGLPKVRIAPHEYKAVFSVSDVIQEYIRPARYIVNHEEVVRPALSDIELIDLPKVGTVEAFNTDGLRSLLSNLSVPDMKEKTLRWPGHAEKMKFLREAGFFSTKNIFSGGSYKTPLETTTAIFKKAWLLYPEDIDITIMHIKGSGLIKGKPTTITYDLYDEKDPVTGYHSMARTTGFPCSIVAKMLARNQISIEPAIFNMEELSHHTEFTSLFFRELAKYKLSVISTP